MAAITTIKPRGIDITGDYVVNSLSSTGNVTAANIKTDNLLYANGSPYAFTTNAAGTNTQIQFNDGNSFAGSANLTFDKTSNTLSVDNIEVTGNIIPTSNEVFDLGNATNKFRDLYLSGNTLQIGEGAITIDGNSMVLTNPLGGQFIVDGSNAAYASLAAYVTEGNQSNITQVGTLVSLDVLTSITTANIKTDYLLHSNGVAWSFATSAQGNLADSALQPNDNISELTNDSGYLVAANLSQLGSTEIVTDGNVTANIITANTLAVASITTGSGSGGNITNANWIIANYFSGSGNNLSNIQAANVTGLGNIATVNLDGNSSNILYGNGVFSSSPVTYNDSNVATYLSSLGSTSITTTGNITAGYFLGNGANLTNISAATLNGHADTYFTGYVDDAIANLIDSAPGVLDTLNELANALGNDASFSTSITNSLANKADISSLSTVATTGNYQDLNNLPTLFDGEYSSLANTPSLFSGEYADLANKPTLFSGSYLDLTNTPSLFDGEYDSLANKPSLFSGSYLDLTNTPTLGNLSTVDKDGNASNILYGNGVFASAPTAYGDSNVATYLPTYSGNLSANVVSANYFIGNGSNLSAIAGANVTGFVANANIANTAYSVAVANVSGIGNIATLNLDGNTSNVLYGNGVFAAPAAGSSYSDSNVETYLPNYAGNLSPGHISIDVANLAISGGTADYVLTTDGTGNLSWVEQASGGSSSGGESTVTSVDTFTGDGIETVFTLSVTPGSINQTFINYNGALQLRSAYTLSGAEITFSEAPADGSLIEVTTQMGVTSGSGNLTVRNYVADGVQTTYAVSSGVNATNILVTENGLVQTPTTDYTVSAGVLTFTDAPGFGVKIQVRELGVAVSTITPVGSNTQVLFNDAGSFGHSAGFTFNKTTSTLSANNIISGNILPSANITYDLGSPTMSWKDLYLSGNTIHLGGARISVDNTSGAVSLTPAATDDNPTPAPQVISSTRYISMVKTGNITAPDTGTSRYYPPKDVTISNVLASLSTASTSNLQFTINKNGSNTGAYTIAANAYQLTKTVANISLTTTDYLTVNILTGEGAAELRLDLEYTDA